MSKGKSITLLSIIGVILAALIVFTFVSFPVGVKTFNGVLGAIELDYDLEGGVAYTLTLSDDNMKDVDDVNDVVESIKDRLDALGYEICSVKAIKSTEKGVKDYDIRIEAKNTESLSSDISAVIAFGEMHIYGGTSTDSLTEILVGKDAIDSAKYTGSSYYNDTTYQGFTVTFTEEAQEKLDKAMKNASAYYLKVTLDDKDSESATTILDTSSSSFSVYTNGSQSNAYNDGTLSLSYSSETNYGVKENVMLFNFGGLDYIYEIDSTEEVTAPLGENVVTVSIIIIAVIIALVIAALSIMYKGFGLISGLSMIFFILIELSMLIAVPGIVLNIGGIVGILAAVLLTADGFIITAKRIKEENSNGKVIKMAFTYGYRRSLFPILASTVVSAVLSLLLVLFASGVVKGFAITFGIGAIISAISTLLFTRLFSTLLFPLFTDKVSGDGTGKEKLNKFFNLNKAED